MLAFSAVEQSSLVNMIKTGNPMQTVPSCHTVGQTNLARHVKLQKQVNSLNHSYSSTTFLACDAWSSHVYRGYMAVTAHWIDNNWDMRNTVLEFVRFWTPHTADASSKILHEIICEWGIEKTFYWVTTYNASDVVKAVELLQKEFYESHQNGRSSPAANFHVRCIAYVLNLAFKACMGLVCSRIKKIF